jgi:ribosome biogenesis protein Tsr3
MAKNDTKKKSSPKSSPKKKVTKKVAKKKTVKKAAPKKAAPKIARSRNAKIKVTPEQRHNMICEAAYFISLERSSETVNPTEDWLQAERAIDKILIVRSN